MTTTLKIVAAGILHLASLVAVFYTFYIATDALAKISPPYPSIALMIMFVFALRGIDASLDKMNARILLHARDV